MMDNVSGDEDDDIFQGPRRTTNYAWPEDRWEEEMEKHPFFMTKAPSENEELPPLLEGLQQLKYDEDENTPEELAIAYKDDGVVCFKAKKYNNAIANFTAGLKNDCSSKLKAELYNNRAAAHYYLENYRSAAIDCQQALKIQEGYHKPELRLVNCLFKLERFKECIELCDKILLRDDKLEAIQKLKKDALTALKIKLRDARKRNAIENKKNTEWKEVVDAVEKRKIKFSKIHSSIRDALKLPENEQVAHNHPVRLENGVLIWVVRFLCPATNSYHTILEFNEQCSFREMLEIMYDENEDWDGINNCRPGSHRPDNVTISLTNSEAQATATISVDSTLGEALQHKAFELYHGIPQFIVALKQ